MSDLPPTVFNSWVHAREEDEGDVMVYRPRGYQLPLARGRSGFEIRPDGEFRQYDMGPVDRSVPIPGHWQLTGPDTIRVDLEGQPDRSHTLHIVSSGEDMLKVRQEP